MPHFAGKIAKRNTRPTVTTGLLASKTAVRKAAKVASEALTAQGVRHLFAGGIAVAAWGYPRATSDVDFLVGDEAFIKHGRIVSHRPGIPIMVDGVQIDLVTMPRLQESVEQELNGNKGGGVVSLPFLVLMKLDIYRGRDQQDILELLRVDADRPYQVKAALSGILDKHLQTRLDRCIELAKEP